MTIPVAYIGGSARSGSTLLERLLGQAPGYWPVGELMFIWERGLRRNDLCGCGTRFLDCPFWSAVGKAGFGGWEQIDVPEAVGLCRSVVRHRNLARIAAGRRLTSEPLAVYRDLLTRLYRAIREVSGASVVIDSSKDISYAVLLGSIDDLDLRLIHLIRRSHGVVHSWSRQISQPGVGDGSGFMSVHPPWWSAGLWIADNLLYEVVTWRTPHATQLRYEDLVASPRKELRRVLYELELPGDDAAKALSRGNTPELAVSHALSGNPMRFQTGSVALRLDEAWRTAMPRRRRVAVSAMTWPMLWHYGYLHLPMTGQRR